MSRHTTPATVGDGGDGLARILARRWLVQFENGEAVRRYQEPVDLVRVLSEHRAALAAVPMMES